MLSDGNSHLAARVKTLALGVDGSGRPVGTRREGSACTLMPARLVPWAHTRDPDAPMKHLRAQVNRRPCDEQQ